MKTISHDTIFTNVALLPDGDVWWEGKDGEPPKEAIDWRGQKWTPASSAKAGHPNSRFTSPMTNNPTLSKHVNHPEREPISPSIFSGRATHPLPPLPQPSHSPHPFFLR